MTLVVLPAAFVGKSRTGWVPRISTIVDRASHLSDQAGLYMVRGDNHE